MSKRVGIGPGMGRYVSHWTGPDVPGSYPVATSTDMFTGRRNKMLFLIKCRAYWYLVACATLYKCAALYYMDFRLRVS